MTECLYLQLKCFFSELIADISFQVECRRSCLTVRHMKSNVSSIFHEDKWRRHDPNVKWAVRKASAYSTDRTLTDKLQEQVWSDDSDTSGSVQIFFPTAPQLENSYV